MSITLTKRDQSQPRAAARPAQAEKKLAAVNRFALWLVLIPACIDYRFPNPTTITLAIYSVLTILSVVGTVILLARYRPHKGSSANWSAGIAIAFTAASIGIGLLRGQDIIEVVRAAPPLILFCSALMATSSLRAGGADPRAIWRDLIAAAFIGMVSQIILAFSVGHVALSTVRYEVLSSAAPLVWGYADGLLLSGGWSLLALPVLAVHFGSIMISITRTQIIVGILPIVIAALATRGRVLVRNTTIVGLFAMGFGLVAALSIGAAAPDSPINRWETRLFSQGEHHGYDVTALTREGEAKFQIQKLGADPVGLLTGFGISAPTAFDGETAALIEKLVGDNNGYWSETGFGHNHYVGTIFVGGLLFGGALLFAQLRGLICAAIAIQRLMRPEYFARYRSVINFPLAYLAFCAFGTLGGLLGARGSGLLFGFTLGMVLWIYEATAPQSGTGG